MGAVSNPIRLGANSALASPAFDDLFLPLYSGEVLTRFNEYLGVTSRVAKKNIVSGNTAKFPRIGGMGAERHAIGTKLLGLDAERTSLQIQTDERPLISHFRVDDIDEMMSQFEQRSEYAAQSAQALAEAQDQYTYRLLINASRATPTSLYGGSASAFPGGGFDGAGAAKSATLHALGTDATDDQIGNFLTALDDIIIRWDEIRVPFDGRNVDIDARFWHNIRQFGSPRSATDLNNGRHPLFMTNDGTYGPPGGQQQFAAGSVPDFNTGLMYNGMTIRRSNILGAQVMGQDLSNDDEAKYQGDFTATRAIAYQSLAVGVVVKMGVMTESERDVSRQDFLFLTKMLSGGGTVRPECAIEIVDD
jgi:hypothetical protein